MTPAELGRWLGSAKLSKITGRTIVSPSRLKADLTSSRARGYYATRGENVSDVTAVAAPLKIGASTFGVAIAGPIQRMAKRESVLGRRLIRHLRTIEAIVQSAAQK
jgi:IclR family transcriptional regulator, acetate operon repressor